METIRRKSLLYRSGLGFWCVNPVQGCAHGCRYPCYASLMARRYGRARDEADWRASVLTKGFLPLELADRRFDRGNTLGISLVSLDEGFRERFEPGAAPYRERIAALESLHGAGCRTLVHIEPYPTPNIVRQEIGPLLEAVAFVDELYFGGWNYSPLAGAYAGRDSFYREQARAVRAFCRERRIRGTVGS
jgi:DNA repair photolyase